MGFSPTRPLLKQFCYFQVSLLLIIIIIITILAKKPKHVFSPFLTCSVYIFLGAIFDESPTTFVVICFTVCISWLHSTRSNDHQRKLVRNERILLMGLNTSTFLLLLGIKNEHCILLFYYTLYCGLC